MFHCSLLYNQKIVVRSNLTYLLNEYRNVDAISGIDFRLFTRYDLPTLELEDTLEAIRKSREPHNFIVVATRRSLS